MTGVKLSVIPTVKSRAIPTSRVDTSQSSKEVTKLDVGIKQDTIQSLKHEFVLKPKLDTKVKTIQRSKQILQPKLKLVSPVKTVTPTKTKNTTRVPSIVYIQLKVKEKIF